jgi:hypothetical protein
MKHHFPGTAMPPNILAYDQFAPDPWSFDIIYVDKRYICPLCQISTGPTESDRAQLEFGLCQAILPVAVCEICYVELPYLLTTLPDQLVHPRRSALIRLAELRGVPDERVLMIDYLKKNLAKMCRSCAFETYFSVVRARPSRLRVTRRLAKKRWKALIGSLQLTLAALYEIVPASVSIGADRVPGRGVGVVLLSSVGCYVRLPRRAG